MTAPDIERRQAKGLLTPLEAAALRMPPAAPAAPDLVTIANRAPVANEPAASPPVFRGWRTAAHAPADVALVGRGATQACYCFRRGDVWYYGRPEPEPLWPLPWTPVEARVRDR